MTLFAEVSEELPQMTLYPDTVLLPHTTEEAVVEVLPHTTELPFTLLPQTTELPHTTELPQTTELPHTTEFPFTRDTLPLGLITAWGERALPELAGALSSLATAAATSR